MNKHTALRMLKDFNQCLFNEEIKEDYFLTILKNYIEVE
jgi:hypothetical protein